MNAEQFVRQCIENYRKVELFSDDLFNDIDEVLKRLDREISFFEEREYLSTSPETVYSALLSLDRKHVAHVNIKKAGAEEGKGYYQKTVEQLVSCFCDDVDVTEGYSRNIVTVAVSGTLKPAWIGEDDTLPRKAIQQSFAPMKSWTDYPFYEQLLKRLLGDELRKVRVRIGIDEEHTAFVFPPSEEADRAITEFEQTHLKDDFLQSDHLKPHDLPELPQPTIENINEICDALGLTPLSEDSDLFDTDFLRGTNESYRPPKPKSPFWEKWGDRFIAFVWGAAAIIIGMLIYDITTTEPKCYPFEEYIAETDQCAVGCLEGETQAECDARAEKLRQEAE